MGYSGPIETGGAVRAVDPEAQAATSRARWRHRLLFAFAIALIFGVSAYGVHWFNDNIRYVSTDDAYVDAQLADIAPEIDGTISQVLVSDTQNVRRGDLLLRLDPADAGLAAEQAAGGRQLRPGPAPCAAIHRQCERGGSQCRGAPSRCGARYPGIQPQGRAGGKRRGFARGTQHGQQRPG